METKEIRQTKLMGVKHNQPESAKSEEVDELSNYLRNGITYALKIDYALELAYSIADEMLREENV